MAIKKVHRRRDLLDNAKRADPIIPGLGSTSTRTTSTVAQGPGVIEPTGPPLVNQSSSSSRSTSTSSHSSSSSSSASSMSTSTSSTTVPTTPPAGTPVSSASVSNPPAIVTRTTTTRVSSTSTRSTASATSTGDADTGMGLGSIAGIGVAAVVAIGCLTAFAIWFIKRRNKNRDLDEEPFNRNSFLRNSTAIPDDDDAPPLSRTRVAPAMPAMSERTPTPLYGQPNSTFAGVGAHDGFGYATQPSYGVPPGGMYSPNPFGPGGAPATPLPHSAGYGTTYDQGFGGPNGGYTEMTRGGMHEYPPNSPPLENPHSPGYNGHDSYPMPPPAAVHGGNSDGIVHSMTPAGQGQVVNVNYSEHDGRETPVQLGFAPQHPPTYPAGQQGHPGPNGKARPDTVYDPDDAYGGI